MGKRAGKLFIILFLFIILLSLVSAASYSVKVTNEHPFLLMNWKYVPASELKVGDELKTVDGKKARVTGIHDVFSENPFEVYNLETALYHDFVLPGGIVVHNSDSPEIQELISNIDLNNLNQEQVLRISGAEADLGGIQFNDLQRRTLLGVHDYKGIKSECLNYKKGRALRNAFSEEETRILMTRG